MSNNTKINRKAYTLAEFASLMGRSRSYAYRLARTGKIKTIKGFGCELVSAAEINRILGDAQTGEDNA